MSFSARLYETIIISVAVTKYEATYCRIYQLLLQQTPELVSPTEVRSGPLAGRFNEVRTRQEVLPGWHRVCGTENMFA